MQRAAVIVNPTKVKDLRSLRDQLAAVFRGYGWAPPLWSETSVEQPGTSQAHDALARGVDLVAVLGGDGTIRYVATAMLGTGTPLAVLAGGTGNLFARQLRLPVGRYVDALRIALSGTDTPIDAMRVGLDADGSGDFADEHIGLVMGGIGRDADIMAGTTERLKSRIGWLAYPVAGMKQVRHERFPAHISFDDLPPFSRDVTSVLAGNCGLLQGGLRLMPDAVVDDGLLDALVVRGGGLRWAPVLGKVVVRSRTDSAHFRRAQCARLTVSADSPQRVQLDGDVIGVAHAARFWADRGALTVRLPRR